MNSKNQTAVLILNNKIQIIFTLIILKIWCFKIHVEVKTVICNAVR